MRAAIAAARGEARLGLLCRTLCFARSISESTLRGSREPSGGRSFHGRPERLWEHPSPLCGGYGDRRRFVGESPCSRRCPLGWLPVHGVYLSRYMPGIPVYWQVFRLVLTPPSKNKTVLHSAVVMVVHVPWELETELGACSGSVIDTSWRAPPHTFLSWIREKHLSLLDSSAMIRCCCLQAAIFRMAPGILHFALDAAGNMFESCFAIVIFDGLVTLNIKLGQFIIAYLVPGIYFLKSGRRN